MSAVEQLYAQIEGGRSRRKSKRVPGPSEDQMHMALADQIRARKVPGVLWWHTPNGTKLGGRKVIGKGGKAIPLQAIRLKRMGVQPGVPDFLLLHNSRLFGVELKAADGHPTAEQQQFASDMNHAGGNAVICYDLDRALRCLECWGLIR